MSSDRADQFECTARLLEVTPDVVLVSNLGVASYVLAGVADRPQNFYCWGSMGSTTAIGLGLALSVDDSVTVLEGDGSLLMSLGTLATVADRDPPNLVVVVWDNTAYATTGGQSTASDIVDIAGVARECGLTAMRVSSTSGFERTYREAVATEGAAVVVCEVDPVDPDVRPPLDFAHIARRFRSSVAGGEASD